MSQESEERELGDKKKVKGGKGKGKGKPNNKPVGSGGKVLLSPNKPFTLQKKGVNTFSFTLGKVTPGAKFTIWFYSPPNGVPFSGTEPFIGLKEPLAGVLLKEGDKIIVEIKPQQFNGYKLDVLLRVYDDKNILKSYCGFTQGNTKFVTDRIQFQGTNIGMLDDTIFQSSKVARLSVATEKSADDTVDVRPVEVRGIVNSSANNSATNFSISQNEPLSFNNETLSFSGGGRRLGGLGSTGANLDWAAGVAFLAFAAFILIAKKLRNVNKPRNPGPT